MTTQKQALSTIKQGGKIQNNILLDADGYPLGTLKNSQLKALLDKGLKKTVLYDQTEVIS